MTMYKATTVKIPSSKCFATTTLIRSSVFLITFFSTCKTNMRTLTVLTHMPVELPCSSMVGHKPTGTFLEKIANNTIF